MSDNVVPWNGITKLDTDPQQVVERAAEAGLTGVVIIGFDAHGGGWFDLKVGERGFRAFDNFTKLHFPGDPPLHAYAEATLHLGTDKPEQWKLIIARKRFLK